MEVAYLCVFVAYGLARLHISYCCEFAGVGGYFPSFFFVLLAMLLWLLICYYSFFLVIKRVAYCLLLLAYAILED